VNKYTVALLYPEYIGLGETYTAHVEAEDPDEAVELAQIEAVEANVEEAEASEDFRPIMVAPGFLINKSDPYTRKLEIIDNKVTLIYEGIGEGVKVKAEIEYEIDSYHVSVAFYLSTPLGGRKLRVLPVNKHHFSSGLIAAVTGLLVMENIEITSQILTSLYASCTSLAEITKSKL